MPERHDHRHVPYSATTWAERTVSSNKIAKLLNIQAATIPQAVLRGSFPPAPTSNGRAGSWPLPEVLTHIVEHRPTALARLPRLWPRDGKPAPATFLGSRDITLQYLLNQKPYRFAVYLWQPSDGAGPVALAYRIGGPEYHLEAPDLLTRLQELLPDLTAVAQPWPSSGARSAVEVLTPPAIDYADDSAYSPGYDEYSWFDLAYLLQADLPFWPTALRDSAAMLRWQPGDAPVGIVPSVPYLGDLKAVARLGSDEPAGVLAQFGAAWAEHIAHDLTEFAYVTAAIPAGIHIAAQPLSPITGSVLTPDPEHDRSSSTAPPVDAEMTLRAMQKPVSEQAYTAVKPFRYSYPMWSPWISYVSWVEWESSNTFVRQWLDDLIEIDEAPIDMGFREVCDFAQDEYCKIHDVDTAPAPVRLTYRDDGRRDGAWIARVGNVVAFSVPEAIPAATGHLKQLALVRGEATTLLTAWWTDTSNRVWPMPGYRHYEAGFDGSGPGDLAEAASVLAHDAARPVTSSTTREGAAGPEFAELRAMVVRRRYPELVTRLDLLDGGFRWHGEQPTTFERRHG